MTMAPHLWPRKNPETVSQEFDKRHGAGTLPNCFMWAVWAAEGSDYLEKLDAGHPGEAPVPPTGSHPDLVDISHVRWATGNAITAIDLCAATMGRLFCGNTGSQELSLRDFGPAGQKTVKTPAAFYRWLPACTPRTKRLRAQTKIAARRNLLPADFLQWVDDTRADQRYIDVLRARNPFTHAVLRRHLFSRGAGHVNRTQFQVRRTTLNAHDMVVMSAALALDRVRAFVEVVDQH